MASNEVVIIGQAPEDEAPGMSLDAMIELINEVGPAALSPEELELVTQAQTKEDFKPGAWFENLADKVDQSELGRIAQDIWRWVEWDEASRKEWMLREEEGIRMLGITDNMDAAQVLEGLSSVVHPGLAEAVVQFWARSITEIYPSEGPVKAQVLGESTDELEKQAERVAGFMNYQYLQLMPGAYQEKRRLLMRLPLSGSVFTKVYYDPELETNMAVTMEPADFLVPYSANNLRTTPRMTHRLWVGDHLMQQRMESGYYRRIKLANATESRYPSTKRVIEETEGRTPIQFIEDKRFNVLECQCWLKIKGIEDGGFNKERLPNWLGIMSEPPQAWEDKRDVLPWVITINMDSQQVLSIRRNWKEGDDKRNRLDHVVEWQFLPGLGFYGLGLAHFMGGLAKAQTGMTRAVLDSSAYENLQGGFKASDLKIDIDTPLKPGEFRKVEATIDEIGKGIVLLPRHSPSDTAVKMLEYLDGWQNRFSSTVDSVVGDANNTGPVGTTLALIEQALKVPTAIHAGLHESFRQEMIILARLNSENMPHQFQYRTVGKDNTVYAADFDDRIDIVPVSDPRLSTNTQKITQQQALLQLASQAPPGMFDLREINKRMLQALRVDDIDKLLPDTDPQRMEPIEEGMAMLVNKPIKAFADQDHQAHLMIHQQWFQQLPPEFQQQLQAGYMAHTAEHLAWAYRLQMEQIIGAQLPPTQIMERNADPKDKPELPIEIEKAIEQAGAQAAQQLAAYQQAIQLQNQQAQDEQAEVERLKAKQQEALQHQAKQTAFEREEMRKDQAAQAEIERNNAIAQAERQQAANGDMKERIEQQSEAYQ